MFHQLPRDDSLSLRSVSPLAGPKSEMFYVIREVLPICKLCHTLFLRNKTFRYVSLRPRADSHCDQAHHQGEFRRNPSP